MGMNPVVSLSTKAIQEINEILSRGKGVEIAVRANWWFGKRPVKRNMRSLYRDNGNSHYGLSEE